MARIAGINIPMNKHVCIGLTSIYGIGRPTADLICEKTKIDPMRLINDLSQDELKTITTVIDGEYKVEGRLRTEIGLNIKKRAPAPFTFVAGYTNGYIYYAPTAEQLRNVGNAQEDSDCILAPEWQAIYESKVAEMLRGL